MQNKMDFTLSAYKQLISTLQFQGYFCQTFEEYIQNSKEKVVILRHDVDRKPGNAFVIAKIEKEAEGRRSAVYAPAVLAHCRGRKLRRAKEIRRARARDRDPQITQIDADLRFSHRHTLTHTDIYPADLAGQKESSLRERYLVL